MRALLIVLVLTLLTPVTAHSWSLLGSYDDCILDNMSSATTKLAVYDIRKSCRSKFPIKTKKVQLNKNVPYEVLEKLDVEGGFSDYQDRKKFTGTAYNKNNDWILREITIRITNKQTKKYRDYSANFRVGFSSTQLFTLDTADFYFTVFRRPSSWSWSIVSAKGFKKR